MIEKINDSFAVNYNDVNNILNDLNEKKLYREIRCECGNIIRVPLMVNSESIDRFNRLINIIKDSINDFPELEEKICKRIINRILDAFYNNLLEE